MKHLFVITLLLACTSAFSQHSSVNCLDFNGTSDYAQVSYNSAFNPGAAFTVEAWINADSYGSQSWNNTIVSTDMWSSVSHGWVLRCGDGGKLSFTLALNNNSNWYEIVTTSSVMSINKWYHVAGTYDGATMRLYLNGVQVGTLTQSGTITATTAPLKIGNIAMSGQSRFFDGEIDEVRIWGAALSQTTLRDYMCHKINGSHPNLNKLIAHYTLNAGTGNAITDAGTNALNGSKVGAAWAISGAPLGDGSAYTYPSAWTGVNFKFGHIDGDTMVVSNMSGNPQGVHIYFVDSQPNIITPPPGVTSFYSTRFYGVYTTTGSNVTYKATYQYDGFPFSGNQGDLNYNYRTSNADTTWANLAIALDTVAHTMVKTSLTTGEFILGKNDALNGFDINNPANNSTYLLQGPVTNAASFNWFSSQLSGGGQTSYKLLLDYDTADFSSPLMNRNSDLQGNDTNANVINLYLSNLMSQEGFNLGDTMHAKWMVKATAGPVNRNSNQQFDIDIIRGILSSDQINLFKVDQPDDDTLEVYNNGANTSVFNWERTTSNVGSNIKYTVELSKYFDNLSSPIGSFVADNGGSDTTASITDADLALMMQNASVPDKLYFEFKWRVKAEIGSLVSYSSDSNYVYLFREDDPFEGIEDFLNVNWKVYPNPVTNKIIIDLNRTNSTEYFIELMDITGKTMLKKQTITSDQLTLEIPEDLVNGLYLLKISDGLKYNSKRIVLERE